MKSILTKNIKNKRGLSLIELMVVTAILTTLTSIAVPSYITYRRSAKKMAYKTDLLSLSKAYNVFAEEFGSYCIRKTEPFVSTLVNVGMISLYYSPLYGGPGPDGAGVPPTRAMCSDNNYLRPEGCDRDKLGSCTHCAKGGGYFLGATPRSLPHPKTENFIGSILASGSQCTGHLVNHFNNLIKHNRFTKLDPYCQTHDSWYRKGVYGHIGGGVYYGVSINQNRTLSSEYEDKPNNPARAQTNCDLL